MIEILILFSPSGTQLFLRWPPVIKMDQSFCEIVAFVQALNSETKDYVESCESPEPYEQTLVMHTLVKVFCDSRGGESFETTSDTGFRENFYYTYEELQAKYETQKPELELRRLFECLVEEDDIVLPPEWKILIFLERQVKTDPVPSEDDLYEEIRAEFNLRSLEKTKEIIEVFKKDNTFNLYRWRAFEVLEKLEEFVPTYQWK